MKSRTATVLGAGIQGVCVALMLKKHGYHVHLIDKSRDLINRASLTHEGKIHLGFVYGMDRSLETGYRMIRDALHFAPYLEYLLDSKEAWHRLKSKPNLYLVARDSMLSPREVEDYFAHLDARFRESLADETLHYLGETPDIIFSKAPVPGYVNPDVVAAAFRTAEVSIDQARLKNRLKKKILESPSISLFLEHRVTAVAPRSQGFSVECIRKDGSARTFRSDRVFNCLWESRIFFDRMMGLNGEAESSLRLKYGLLVKAGDFIRGLDAFTMIHGAYGSLVVSAYDSQAFCCWYPACLEGMMAYDTLPEAWERACEGHADSALVERLRRENDAAFRNVIPGLPPLDVVGVKAGVILAAGKKDITERDSALHTRSDFPIRHTDGYYSVSTSKYTSAPRNTLLLEQMLARGT